MREWGHPTGRRIDEKGKDFSLPVDLFQPQYSAKDLVWIKKEGMQTLEKLEKMRKEFTRKYGGKQTTQPRNTKVVKILFYLQCEENRRGGQLIT